MHLVISNMNTTEDQFVPKDVHLNAIAELSREIEALKERYQKTFLNVVLSADGQEDLRNKLREKDDAIHGLESAVASLKHDHAAEHARLTSEVHSLQRQLSEKCRAVSEFETQLRDVHEALQSVEARIKGVEIERTELHQRVEGLQREVTDKTARISELNQLEARQCDVIDELQQQLHDLTREGTQRSEQMTALHRTVEALQHDKQLLQERLNSLPLTAPHTSTVAPHTNTAAPHTSTLAPHTNTAAPQMTSPSAAAPQTDAKAPNTTSPSTTAPRHTPHAAPSTRDQALAVTQSDAPRVTSPKRVTKPAESAPVVCFSGFKDGEYNDALKSSLTEFVVDSLHGQVHDTAEFSHHITHVVTPPHTRTLKTLAAVLTCKWLVTPEWLIDAQRARSADPEAALPRPDKYGIRLREAPLKDKAVAIHSSFSAGSEGAAKLKNADILLKVGKAKRAKESEASVVLVSDELEGHKSNYYTWAQFMELILAQVPAALKEKSKRKIDAVTSPEAAKHKKAKTVHK